MNKGVIFAALSMVIAINAAAEHWATGYYQANGDNPVFYYNDEYRWYCQIQNATQLNTYNATQQVRVVGDVNGFLEEAVSLGNCPWLDGYYNTSDDGTIYRLYPGNACVITTPQMLDAYGATNSVITTESGADFTVHRNNIGQCFWPY